MIKLTSGAGQIVDQNIDMTLLVLNIHNLVEKLIMGAAISSLGRYLSDKPMDFLNHDRDFTNYYTNRGEYTEIRHFKDFDDYNENHQYEEFEYIFTKDNVWSVFDGNDWHDLEYVIQEKGYTDPYDMKEEAA